MKKLIPLVAVVLLFCGFKSDRSNAISLDANPFGNLHYQYGSTDTVKLKVDYMKTGDLSESNKYLLSVISKNSRCNFKKINYAIAFNIPGFKKTFYAPSKDVTFLKALTSEGKQVKKLDLTCVVYRFYYMD